MDKLPIVFSFTQLMCMPSTGFHSQRIVSSTNSKYFIFLTICRFFCECVYLCIGLEPQFVCSRFVCGSSLNYEEQLICNFIVWISIISVWLWLLVVIASSGFIIKIKALISSRYLLINFVTVVCEFKRKSNIAKSKTKTFKILCRKMFKLNVIKWWHRPDSTMIYHIYKWR